MNPQVLLLASSADSSISAWDVQTGTGLTSYKGNSSPMNGLCSMGRDFLVSTQLGKPGIHVWTWHKDHVHQRSFPPEQITAIACTLDGAYCAAGGISGAVHLWEVSTGRLLRSWPAHYKRVTCLTFSASGAELVTGGEDTLVSAWLLAEVLDSGAPQAYHMGAASTAPLHAWSDHTMPVTAVAIGAGTTDPIVVSTSTDRSLRIRSFATGAVLRTVAFPVPLSTLALDPGEHAVYAGASTGVIFHLSLVDRKHTEEGSASEWTAMEGHSKAVTSLAFTGDAAHLVSGSEDGSARVWDLRTRQPVRTIEAPGKVPITGLLILDRPVQMPMGAQGGEGRGGRKGPKRLQPLAQFSKYAGTSSGNAKAWEGGLVLLDGSGAASESVTINEFEYMGIGGSRSSAVMNIVPGGGGEEMAALREENEKLKLHAQQAMALAQKWKALNHELQEVALVPASAAQPATQASSPAATPTEISIARHKLNVDDAARELASSQFYARLKTCLHSSASAPRSEETPLPVELLTDEGESSNAPHLLLQYIKHYVIYGLGSLEQPGAVHIRYQLALASLIANLLPHLKSPPEAYDPVFTPHDNAVLPLYGISITKYNEEGRRIAREPTLFFMPHCETELTNNLLESNAQAGTLQNVVILGNSFAQYHERWSMARPGQTGRQPPATLLQLCESGQVLEVVVDDSDFPVPTAFNDLSLHTFSGAYPSS